MPGPRNKIIINNKRLRGEHRLLMADYSEARFLAKEADELGLLDQMHDLKEEMEAGCAEHTAANMRHHELVRSVSDRMRKLIDAHRFPPDGTGADIKRATTARRRGVARGKG